MYPREPNRKLTCFSEINPQQRQELFRHMRRSFLESHDQAQIRADQVSRSAAAKFGCRLPHCSNAEFHASS